MEEFICPQCSRIFPSKRSLAQHYRRHSQPIWNKGQTKETNSSIKRGGEVYSERHSLGEVKTWSQGKTKETDQKVAQAAAATARSLNRKVQEGTWHNSFSRSRTIEYNGTRFYGSWEVAFAKYLDLNNISWRRPKESFVYVLDDRERRYTPDFYLLESKTYVEIKGYPTDKDLAKWKDFPLPLRILMGEHLLHLGLIKDFRSFDKREELTLLGFTETPEYWERL